MYFWKDKTYKVGEMMWSIWENKLSQDDRAGFSGKSEGRNPVRISQHVRIRARMTGPGVEGVNH